MMNVLGIGILFTRGSGVACFEKALNDGWQEPAGEADANLKDKISPAYQVVLETVTGRALLKKMRRSDKLSKMAVLAASDALRSSAIENMNKKRLGIIVATAFGPQVTTFKFLDEILDYGEANVSPIIFSNSVHNAPAAYVSSALDIQGPTLTVTQFYFSFQYALQLAQAWINEGRCDYILVGAVDQYGDVLKYVHDCKLTPAPDNRIRPFNFNPTYHVPGEGAVFILVGKGNSKNAFCKVENVWIGEHPECKAPADIDIIDTDGMLADESAYFSSISPDIPVAAYSPLFGSMMVGSAFNCAAGVLMLKNQVCYANPVRDNPHGIKLLNNAGSINIELVRCIRYNCQGEKAAIYLKKK
jgi:3-oxoacyl-[acyl-carrier-protein] synthase II